MANGRPVNPVDKVLSGIIPEILEKTIGYAADTAEEFCRLGTISKDWKVASERNHIWGPICQQTGCTFDQFTDIPSDDANTSPIYNRAKWKSLYVLDESIKAKMRKGEGVWKEPVQFDLQQFGQARVLKVLSSDTYVCVVLVTNNRRGPDTAVVAVYRKATGALVSTLYPPNPGASVFDNACMDRTGSRLITTCTHQGVRIWDVEQGICKHIMPPQPFNPIRYSPSKNSIIMVKTTESGRQTLQAYNVETAEHMQTSARVQRMAASCNEILMSEDKMLSVTDVMQTRCYAVWNMRDLTCLTVIDDDYGWGRRPEHLLLDVISKSVVSYTRRGQLAAGMNTLKVWDFRGDIKIQLSTDDANDNFCDVVISRHKLIILHSQDISVWSIKTGAKVQRIDLKRGQELQMSQIPDLHKYIFDHKTTYTAGSQLLAAYLKDVVGADLMRHNKQTLFFPRHLEVFVQQPSSTILKCHTLYFNMPAYP